MFTKAEKVCGYVFLWLPLMIAGVCAMSKAIEAGNTRHAASCVVPIFGLGLILTLDIASWLSERGAK